MLIDRLDVAAHDETSDTTWVEKNFAWLRGDVDLDEAQRTGEVPPVLVLQEVGHLLERLGVCLRILPPGLGLWRARMHPEGEVLATASDLGTASRERAKQANRMSPAGIPMFYGAIERDTAIREVAVRSENKLATSGRFETSRPCTIVDFTRLPETQVCSILNGARRGATCASSTASPQR